MERREVLRKGAAAAAALWSGSRVLGANDKVTLALIGGRNQGKGVARRTIEAGGQFKTFCDIDRAIYDEVSPGLASQQGRPMGHEVDYRRVLEDKDIDAVVIAAPDHWHTHMALAALAAGKDCYIEKPLTQTIAEGHLIREATRKYKRVAQVGTQRRSGPHFQAGAAYASTGKLGKVCLVKAWMYQVRKTIGRPADGAAPSTVDYNQWLGPAPERAFNPNRFHYNWRFFWDYGNTELGNQGVHMLDVALAGIQKMKGQVHVLPRKVSSMGSIYWLDDAKEVPDTQVTTYEFGDLLLQWELHSFSAAVPGAATNGTAFYGTEGSVVIDDKGWRVFDAKNALVEEHPAEPMTHEKNFLECLKSRKAPNAEVEIGRLSTTLCHLGNVSQRLGRSVTFDPVKEDFGGDREANAYLTKNYRRGFALPKV